MKSAINSRDGSNKALFLRYWFHKMCEKDNHLSHVMRKPIYATCEQQSCWSACASAQSDQHLLCSLPRLYNISSFYIWNFKPLASFCGCAGWFESYLVENPEDRFSRDMAHFNYCSKPNTDSNYQISDIIISLKDDMYADFISHQMYHIAHNNKQLNHSFLNLFKVYTHNLPRVQISPLFDRQTRWSLPDSIFTMTWSVSTGTGVVRKLPSLVKPIEPLASCREQKT